MRVIALNATTSSLHTAAQDAQRAEALGCDALVTAESKHNAFLPIAVMADHTSRIALGSNVAVAFARSPMVTAYLAWDLQDFSGGRFRLGIGSQVKGHMERRYSVPWSPPAPRMAEYIRALRTIWRAWERREPLDVQGEHYRFSLMPLHWAPDPIDHPHVPLYISAFGPKMYRVVGELCDGVLTHVLLGRKYLDDVVLPNLEIGLRRAGRSRDAVDFAVNMLMAIGDTDEELCRARRSAAEQIGFYGSTRTYRQIFEMHGWGDLPPRLHEMSLTGKWDQMTDLITDEIVDTFVPTGTAEEVARQIVQRFGDAYTSIIWRLPPVTTPEAEARTKAVIASLQAAK